MILRTRAKGTAASRGMFSSQCGSLDCVIGRQSEQYLLRPLLTGHLLSFRWPSKVDDHDHDLSVGQGRILHLKREESGYLLKLSNLSPAGRLED